MSGEEQSISESTRVLFDIYNISLNDVESINIHPRIVAALAHVVNQYGGIQAAAIFGSRTDPQRTVKESSDIDVLIRFKPQYREQWGDICYDILAQIEHQLGKSVCDKLDLSIYSHDHEDPTFKETAYHQAFMIRGSRSDLKS